MVRTGILPVGGDALPTGHFESERDFMRGGKLHWLAVVAFGLFGAMSAVGQPGWYFGAGVGPAWTEDIKVKEFVTRLHGIEAELDLGFRADAKGGYRFC